MFILTLPFFYLNALHSTGPTRIQRVSSWWMKETRVTKVRKLETFKNSEKAIWWPVLVIP
ncbi:hypothetical protein [Chitinophaga costaii]|uniref:hypothetical protein n=1 Tax=Chitinophaga costaii TaxID=1335309 RepID=UPI000F50FA46|nr:hypothetical protein [Chitinophaga costaii]